MASLPTTSTRRRHRGHMSSPSRLLTNTSRSKSRLVRSPGRFLPGVVLIFLLLFAFGGSSESLVWVQRNRVDAGSQGHGIQRSREHHQSKGGRVGRTNEVERVLRVFPVRYDPVTVGIAPGQGGVDLYASQQ